MDLLQYRSNEMFSSTELIRKSKMVFDKISKNEIEKAVILRDGKPSFMLMDFKKYEELINEYLQLKEKLKAKDNLKPKVINKEENKKQIIDEAKNIEKLPKIEESFDEINDYDLQEALAQIEQLNIEPLKKPTAQKEEALKDFWE